MHSWLLKIGISVYLFSVIIIYLLLLSKIEGCKFFLIVPVRKFYNNEFPFEDYLFS